MDYSPANNSNPENFLSELLAGPISKQRDRWLEEVKEVFISLTNAKVDLNNIKENPTFIDVFSNATAFAVRTHEKDKIEAFKNALYNTALHPQDYDLTGILYLNLLSSFTVWHIRVLNLFEDPSLWFDVNKRSPPNLVMGSLRSVINAAFSGIEVSEGYWDLIWNDLKNAGLHRSTELGTSMSGTGLMQKRLSQLGTEFLEFIKK
jgi:hypothetical protein